MVGKIWEEVPEVIEYGLFERSLHHCVEFLVDVKNHYDGEQEQNREYVSAEKLAYDIKVDDFNPRQFLA